jgi:hypothetical protein
MKKSGYSRGPRDFVTFLKRAVPKTLFACTCIETDRQALLLPGRNQAFELRHDSIGGKVTTGLARLRKAPTTTVLKFGR